MFKNQIKDVSPVFYQKYLVLLEHHFKYISQNTLLQKN